MASADVGQLVRDERLNAWLAWAITGVVLVTALGSFLEGDVLWTAFAVAVAVMIVLPPLANGTWRAMLPWEVLFLAALPIIGRTLSTFQVSNQVATYLSVAALALVVTVELHLFTSVRMTPTFAVGFVVIATLATAGIWAVSRWVLDLYLGTGFLLDPALSAGEIERRLMIEFVASAIAGLLAGLIFEFYVRRRVDPPARIAGVVEE